MTTTNLTNVRADFKGAYIEQDDNIKLFLSRQGVSKTLNCAHPLFFVEIGDNGVNNLYSAHVSYSNDTGRHGPKNTGQIYKSSHKLNNENEALRFVEEHAGELAKIPVTVDEQTLSYCHGWTSYDYQKEDKFISPVFYCEYSDTIRLSVSNICLAAFTDGSLDNLDLDVDTAAKQYIPLIERVMSNGFHACDRKNGDDYCKRRLAWLLGCRVLSEMPDVGSKWCNQNMALVKNHL